MAWITDPIFSQGDAECDLIARILGGGKSSRLYKSLVYEKRIAQDVTAQQYSLASGFHLYRSRRPQSPASSRSIWKTPFARNSSGSGPKARRRPNWTGRATRSSPPLSAGWKHRRICRPAESCTIIFWEIRDFLPRDLERYRAATPHPCRSWRSKSSGAKPASWSMECRVQNGQRCPEIPHDSRSVRHGNDRRSRTRNGEPSPLSRAGAAMNLPVPTTFTAAQRFDGLPGGAAHASDVCGKRHHSERQRPESAGTARTGLLHGRNAGRRHRQAPRMEIAADADQLGASISVGSSMDFSYIAARTLKKNADAAFELVSDFS